MKRATLANRSKLKQNIDMDAVYQEIDYGKTVKEVAEKFGVAVSTLYRRHYEYQKNQVN